MITLRTEPIFGLANKILYHPLRVELFPEFHFKYSQFQSTLVMKLWSLMNCLNIKHSVGYMNHA